jgi:hypothetical protein
MHRYTLKLNDLLHEIIPVGQWHLRTAGTMAFSVMGDILPYQHRAQRKLMTEKRDKHHDHDYWSSTSLAFAHQVHPLQNRSYWAAARTTLVAFDWVKHGRNHAKNFSLTPAERELTEKCTLLLLLFNTFSQQI